MTKHIYAPDTTLASDEGKVAELLVASRSNGAMLDSASPAAADAIQQVVSGAGAAPARLSALLDKIDGDKNKAVAVGAMLDGIRRFEQEHGFTPSMDMIDAALSQAVSVADGSQPILPGGMTLDSVSTSLQSTSLSHQPNRIAVALVGGLAESIPFGAYLPADIGSGESKLAIINSVAGSGFGDYADGDILDGVNSGQSYINAERLISATLAADKLSATFAFKAKGNGEGNRLPLVPNRTEVVINGFSVAREINPNATTAARQIAGQVVIKGTTYAITGSVDFAAGTGTLAFNPALPDEQTVEVTGFVDYEGYTELTPTIKTRAESWSLYCSEQRVLMQIAPGARNQAQNELGTDFLTVAVNSARRQMANERFYLALRKVRAVAMNTRRTFDFDAATQMLQKTRAQRWRDYAAFLGEVDQVVANQTMEFGLSMLFVGAKGAANFRTMGADDFVPSGVSARPGIYRVGRYKNLYDVYYTPRGVNETDTDLEMLAIGRATQVARNPIVFSDALAPTMIPLSVGTDLKNGAALYGRQLTQVNPHTASALGCALITVRNVDLLEA